MGVTSPRCRSVCEEDLDNLLVGAIREEKSYNQIWNEDFSR